MIKKVFKTLILLLVVAFAVISAALVLLHYFLVPAIEQKVRQAVAENLGKHAELSQVNIKLPEAIVLVKGLKIADSNLVKYAYSVSVNEATMHVSLISTFLQKKLMFDEVYLKDAVFILEKKNPSVSPEAPSAEIVNPDAAAPKASPESDISKNRFSELYIKKLTMENMEFIFKDYSTVRPPSIIEIVNTSGEIKNLLVSFRTVGNFEGAVHFKGWFNSAQKGSLKVGGTIAKRGNEIDFDLKSEISDVDLTYFSQYYTNTSFVILKEARVDINSDVKCRHSELTTYHDARIYDIKLDDAALTSQDMLFGLPATTVTKFFNDYSGEVKFDFNIGGTLNDPKFEPGPIVKEVMSKAFGDRIAARLRELPRDVVKMSEKAIKGDIDIGKESKIWLEEMGKKLEEIKKDFKKKHDSDNTSDKI
ncbi:MAG: DUF748 domain-containing protein [Candidatus Omnitrophica bacterium]|nr:DUF748 domain-containing protein [Candidatus Omnitrophota bacterium]